MEEEKVSGKKVKSKLFVIKVSSGYEYMTSLILKEKYNSYKVPGVISTLVLDEIKSYIIIESENIADVSSLIYGLKHVKGQVRGTVDFKNLEHLILPKDIISEIKEGYEVEIVWGPFKGSIAEVTRVNKSKNEVTVILKDAITQIPIQLSADYVKIIKK